MDAVHNDMKVCLKNAMRLISCRSDLKSDQEDHMRRKDINALKEDVGSMIDALREYIDLHRNRVDERLQEHEQKIERLLKV